MKVKDVLKKVNKENCVVLVEKDSKTFGYDAIVMFGKPDYVLEVCSKSKNLKKKVKEIGYEGEEAIYIMF